MADLYLSVRRAIESAPAFVTIVLALTTPETVKVTGIAVIECGALPATATFTEHTCIFLYDYETNLCILKKRQITIQ